MARTRSKSKSAVEAAAEASLARALAPEDVRAGDFVAVLYEVVEWPSWFWCGDSTLVPRDEPVRIATIPRDEPVPKKVRAVCLPFVLVRDPCGRESMLDVRRCRLARLDRACAVKARKAHVKAIRKQRADSSTL
jgi:hypothetical protein